MDNPHGSVSEPRSVDGGGSHPSGRRPAILAPGVFDQNVLMIRHYYSA
ncbi:hypothetical protein ACS15_5344 [Ralstonia insidiosa]|uniref:Uncharacterized protein n=1 Tax=Ralstonia insidiosa TaxID=190721 RepID=A0AAC9FSX4_9RALS|nr:hypothetical protein ACS15_5344 [Ralstonia insidiosa]